MRRILTIAIALSLVTVFSATGCEERESNAGKRMKNTLDRAQSAVDKVNQRQEDSIPDEDK